MPSSHLILCHPLLLLPPNPPSIRVFTNESTLCMRWPKYWSFSFSVIPSKEHPGLTSFRMDWLDLLTVQGTLKSLLQHHRSKASVLQHSAFFTIIQIIFIYIYISYKLHIFKVTYFAVPKLLFITFQKQLLLLTWGALVFQRLILYVIINNSFSKD